MSLKEVSSLNSDIESFLNQDTRLEWNKPKPPWYDKEVKDEIWKSRTTTNFYQNKESNVFPSNKDNFKFLGLFTC